MKCKCQFVPGIKGETKIEGYDTKSLYEKWQLVKNIREEIGLTEHEMKTVFEIVGVSDLSKIDPEEFVDEWLIKKRELGESALAHDIAKSMKGEPREPIAGGSIKPRSIFSSIKQAKAGVEKSKTSRNRLVDYKNVPPNMDTDKSWQKIEEHEKAGFWHVSRDVEGRFYAPDEDPNAASNFDLVIERRPWEMKNVTNSRSSVSNQIARARKKWWKLGRQDKMHVVITTENLNDDFSDVVDSVEKKLRSGEVAIVYDEQGNPTRIKK